MVSKKWSQTNGLKQAISNECSQTWYLRSVLVVRLTCLMLRFRIYVTRSGCMYLLVSISSCSLWCNFRYVVWSCDSHARAILSFSYIIVLPYYWTPDSPHDWIYECVIPFFFYIHIFRFMGLYCYIWLSRFSFLAGSWIRYERLSWVVHEKNRSRDTSIHVLQSPVTAL